MAYYSNKLIIYFELENKYPRLAKLIQLRRKFQNYYIGWNISLAIVALIYIMFINISVLIYSNSYKFTITILWLYNRYAEIGRQIPLRMEWFKYRTSSSLVTYNRYNYYRSLIYIHI